jgi:hypothetical protein
MLQVGVLTNQQNGRDSHIRLMKVNGPRLDQAGVLFPSITSNEFRSYAVLR